MRGTTQDFPKESKILSSPKDSGDGQDLKPRGRDYLGIFLRSPKDRGDSEVRLICEMDYLGKANNTAC